MRQLLTILFTAAMFAGVGMSLRVLKDGHEHRSQGGGETHGAAEVAANEDASIKTEFERGPHRGRMIRDGELALEITIFEAGTPPEFHVYPYLSGKPIDPSTVNLEIERLGNEFDKITFSPVEDYLKSNQTVAEPHFI